MKKKRKKKVGKNKEKKVLVKQTPKYTTYKSKSKIPGTIKKYV